MVESSYFIHVNPISYLRVCGLLSGLRLFDEENDQLSSICYLFLNKGNRDLNSLQWRHRRLPAYNKTRGGLEGELIIHN